MNHVIGAGLIIMLAFAVEKAPNAFLIWFCDLPPRAEPRGLTVVYVFDPTVVLWHLAEVTK